MKATPNLAVERYRLRSGQLASSRFDGNNGAFLVPCGGLDLRVIASDGMGWDHVSVSLADRCPTWEEMTHVKDLFFDPGECVIQYHPPKAVYRNAHEYCLHLWRPQNEPIPLPDPELVAPPPGVRGFAAHVNQRVAEHMERGA